MPRVFCAATLSGLLVAAAPGRAETVDRILATIDGDPITTHEVRQYAADRGATTAAPSEVLEVIITDKLMQKEAAALGVQARKEDIDQYVEQIKARNHMDDTQFNQALAGQGLTLEAYRAKVKAELEKAQLVNREIRQRVNVSPQEIERYYEAHLDDYAISEQVKVRDIFFATEPGSDDAGVAHVREKAEEVRALALDGRDFAKLAEQFSEGPGADKGGLLGTFGRGEMEGPLDEAAFQLKPKQVSELIQTPRGFHLLRVDEIAGAGHRPLDDVKEDIREALYNEAIQSRYEDWLSRDLRERHHVEVLN